MEENQRGSRALYVQPPALALASPSSEFYPKEPLNRYELNSCLEKILDF